MSLHFLVIVCTFALLDTCRLSECYWQNCKLTVIDDFVSD